MKEKGERAGDGLRYSATVRVDPPGITLTMTGESSPRTITRKTVNALAYPDGSGDVQHVRVLRGSVLDELRRVSNKLASWYPWDAAAAACYVLTGEYPEIPALSGEIEFRDEIITIRAKSFVASRTVQKFYRGLQRQAGNGGTDKDTSIGARVFRFVEENRDENGNLKSWPELLTLWNEANLEDPYADKTELINRYKQVRRKIIGERRAQLEIRNS